MSRFTPNSGHLQCTSACPLWAKSGLMHCLKGRLYSITSSARAMSAGGTERPRALAVLRFATSSNFVGCSTGQIGGLISLENFVDKDCGALEVRGVVCRVRDQTADPSSVSVARQDSKMVFCRE